MIKTKDDLKRYLECDKIALGRSKSSRPKIFGDDIWKYEILLRKTEYYRNSKSGLINKLLHLFYAYRFHRESIRFGFYIPLNVFDEGLSIAHYGTITVNGNAKVGKNCRLQEMVNIGSTNGDSAAPVIGNNVFIGSGAKIIGNIHIADNVAIGANAVVVHDIDEPNTTWAGVPAKKVSNNGSRSNLCPDIFEEKR